MTSNMHAVGTTGFDKTSTGIMDLHATAVEIVSDYSSCDAYYKNSPEKNPQGCAKNGEAIQERVVRGTWFTFAPKDWDTENHAPPAWARKVFSYGAQGFRCARSVAKPNTM
jgi:hypothetical protein